MDSLDPARALKIAVAMAAIAAVMAPHPRVAQPYASPADEALREIVEDIEGAESQNLTLSPELIDPLTNLGLLYHEEGDYGLAIAAVEQARQIVRVHHGLFSLEEAPLLRQLIRSEEARGNAEAAWDLEQDLLALIGRHPNDVRTVPFLREIADDRMDVLERYVAGELPPEIILGCYYGAQGCRAGSRGVVKLNLQNEALYYYWHAINIVLFNEGYSNDELPQRLMELVRTSYRYGRYSLGRRSLQYLYSYETENSEPWNALILMADWELAFADALYTPLDAEAVLRSYRRAYELLEKDGAEQAAIDAIFAPKVPVVLPSFSPNPLVSKKTSQSTGHVDVAFDITSQGESEHIEVLDTSNASRRAEKDLVRVIKRSAFRPRMTNGEVADSDRVVVRYYVSERDG